MEKSVYTIVQITGEILEITEEVERKDGQIIRHYTLDTKEMDEVSDFVRGLIIQ